MALLITLLPFLASRVLAHSDHAEIQIHDTEVLLALSGYAPICWADSKHSSGARDIRRNGTTKWDCQNGDCDSSGQHPWTHSSPCFRDFESDQELCVFTDTNFADGRGISLVTTTERANYLASNPAFTEPETLHGLNQDLVWTTPAKYEVRPVPGKGMGVVATALIRRGELIMANTASYMIDYAVFNGLSPEEYTHLQAHAVDHLPAAHRAAILDLSPHNTPSANSSSNPTNLTHTALIDKITATNIFDIDPSPSDPDQHHSLAALFPHIARINHDCRPNAEYRFSYPHLAQLVHAARDIFPGEELTISYLNPLQPLAARQKRLSQNWGFTCSCPACSTPDPERARESDSRIAQIQDLRDLLQDWGADSTTTGSIQPIPAVAELLITLYTLERLYTTLHEAYTLAALAYSAVGDEWTAIKYARMAIEYGTPMVGAEDEDIQEMGRLVRDVRGHWSWMRRMRRGERGEGLRREMVEEED